MEYQELIRKRYSVRAYEPRPVEEEKVARILEAARLAPTAANLQAFRIIVIQTKGWEDVASPDLWPGVVRPGSAGLASAPFRAKGWKRKYDGWNAAEVDATIATDHLILAAADEGFGDLLDRGL